MNYNELQNGLNHFQPHININTPERNTFLIAARNAMLRNPGEFIGANNAETNRNVNNAIFIKPAAAAVLDALENLSDDDIVLAESNLYAITHRNTPAELQTIIDTLAPFGIDRDNRNEIETFMLDAGSNDIQARNLLQVARAETIANIGAAGYSQNTNQADDSVMRIIRALTTRYNNLNLENVTVLNAAMEEMSRLVEDTHYPATRRLGNFTFNAEQQRNAARIRGVNTLYLDSQPYLDRYVAPHMQSTLSIKKVLVLIWTAINDRNSIINPEGDGRAVLVDNATNRDVIDRTISDRKRDLVLKTFFEYATEYHVDILNIELIRPACPHGTFNKIVETLNLAHPDVKFYNPKACGLEAAREHLQASLYTAYQAHPKRHPLRAAWNSIDPTAAEEVMIEEFKGAIITSLHPGIQNLLQNNFENDLTEAQRSQIAIMVLKELHEMDVVPFIHAEQVAREEAEAEEDAEAARIAAMPINNLAGLAARLETATIRATRIHVEREEARLRAEEDDRIRAEQAAAILHAQEAARIRAAEAERARNDQVAASINYLRSMNL